MTSLSNVGDFHRPSTIPVTSHVDADNKRNGVKGGKPVPRTKHRTFFPPSVSVSRDTKIDVSRPAHEFTNNRNSRKTFVSAFDSLTKTTK